jgi:hypothetical protein
MADGRKKPKWKKVDDERMWNAIPLPILIKRRDRGSAAPLNQSGHQKAQRIKTDPLPQSATARFPASTACHLKGMENAWRAGIIGGTGEATVLRPMIVGRGRLEDRNPNPLSKWATPLRLPLFMGKARAASFTIYCDVTHACGNRPTHDPHVTHDPPRRAFNAGRGEAQRMKQSLR